MLEKEAKTKTCPVMTAGTLSHTHNMYCRGAGCMAWDEWTDVANKPKEPPEGHCGMIPPEYNIG